MTQAVIRTFEIDATFKYHGVLDDRALFKCISINKDDSPSIVQQLVYVEKPKRGEDYWKVHVTDEPSRYEFVPGKWAKTCDVTHIPDEVSPSYRALALPEVDDSYDRSRER